MPVSPLPPVGDVRMPSLDGLCAFEAAARLGSFERAAQELHITASAVGKRVSTVEDLLGTALFGRAGKTLTLTATGKEYLPQVRAALAMLAEMPLHRRASQRSERLRVTTPPTFARQVLVPHLESFTQRFAHVELELMLSIPYLDIAATESDVEVRMGDAAGHDGMVLMHDVVLPVAAPALLARLPPMRSPADLLQAPLLRTPLEPWSPWFRVAGLDWPEPSHGPKLLDLGLLMEAAVSAQGVALARPSLAKHWLASGTLLRLFSISAMPAHQYHLLPHAQTQAAGEFVAWLRALCERVHREAAALFSGSS